MTKRRTKEDYERVRTIQKDTCFSTPLISFTFPTAASPRSTSLTLLLGLGPESAMVRRIGRQAGRGIEYRVTVSAWGIKRLVNQASAIFRRGLHDGSEYRYWGTIEAVCVIGDEMAEAEVR